MTGDRSERRELPHDPRKVRERLQKRVPENIRRLGITERPVAGLVAPLNPRRADKRAGSFVIWTDGDAAGAYRDYAVAGVEGDVYGLIQYLGALARWIDAYWWALDFLDLQRGEFRTASQAQQERERAEADRLAAEAKAKSDDKKAMGRALALWLTGEPIQEGDLAWRYLTGKRGLPLDRLAGKSPGALRFHPAIDHVDNDTGEVTTWPCLLSAMSRCSDGKVAAVHRTYLAPDGSDKAPVPKAKKMYGKAHGCAIRVWKGDGAMSPEQAARPAFTSPLIITEGIEDALSAAIARPDYRVWAAGSLGLMKFEAWPACASGVVLIKDNDWNSPTAIAAFERVEAHWREMALGRPLKVLSAETGKDLNDYVRGVA